MASIGRRLSAHWPIAFNDPAIEFVRLSGTVQLFGRPASALDLSEVGTATAGCLSRFGGVCTDIAARHRPLSLISILNPACRFTKCLAIRPASAH